MLELLAISLAAGFLAGALLRGRPSGLRTVPIRMLPLLYLAAVAGLIPQFVGTPRGLRLTLLWLSMGAVLAVLIASLVAARGGVQVGLGLIAVGWALNFAAIAPNAGMPLSLDAAARAGIPVSEITTGEGGFFKSVPADGDTVLRPLGDVIPVRPFTMVISFGDLFLMAGVAVVVAAGMRSAAAGEVSPAS